MATTRVVQLGRISWRLYASIHSHTPLKKRGRPSHMAWYEGVATLSRAKGRHAYGAVPSAISTSRIDSCLCLTRLMSK